MPIKTTVVCAMLAGTVILPARADGQGYPNSQRSTVVQNVALTQFTVTYGRPVARGRALWGQLVPWDSVWHPGADSATRIAVDHDVLIEGQTLKAGEYSLWLIPRERGAWTVIFSGAARVFHTPYPGRGQDVLRLDVTPETVSHMETMAIEFPVVLRDDAVMRIHWGTLAAPVRIKASYRP
jgi:hypothetical protein